MPEFRQWLAAVPGDEFKVRRTLCQTNFDISGGGITSVKIHAQGKKHSEAVSSSTMSITVDRFFFFLNLCRLVEAVIHHRCYVLVVVVPAALALPRLGKFFLRVLAHQIPAT